MHGVVWLDANANGIRTDLEAVFGAGTTVNLLQNGQLVATTSTNANGEYSFSNLVPGTYSVQVVPPAGYTLSPRDAGSDDAIDSDVDPGTGQSEPFTLTSGQNLAGPDAGLTQRMPCRPQNMPSPFLFAQWRPFMTNCVCGLCLLFFSLHPT